MIDPRILYDQESQRWIATAIDYESRHVILAGVNEAARILSDMRYFTADDRTPADVCEGKVRECSVYVGIFGTPRFQGSVFEPHSLVALIMYALLSWVLAQMIWLLMADTSADVATRTTTMRSETEHERDRAA